MLGKWKGNEEKQRIFFEKIAKEKGFHHIDQAYKWNEISQDDIERYEVSFILFECVLVCSFYLFI